MKQPFSTEEEARAYDQVTDELRSGIRHESLWLKALVDSSSDRSRAEVLYIKWRVAELTEVAASAARQGEAERLANESQRRVTEERDRSEFLSRFPALATVHEARENELFSRWKTGHDIAAEYDAVCRQQRLLSVITLAGKVAIVLALVVAGIVAALRGTG